ncbi:hypothetical protein DIPPA_16613 [Diplonema papillatum]|nr:hypothetical protein DIPPA_16613 [Diplonema papillatum]
MDLGAAADGPLQVVDEGREAGEEAGPVAIPWVWGHPHHECEWVGDWEIVVSPGTDEKGWAYAFDFKATPTPSYKRTTEHKT